MKKILAGLLLCFTFSYAHFSCAQHSAQLAVDTSFLLPVNGVKQYLEIKGSSRSNPVLLFVHGGPAWPETPMLRKYNQDLTKRFVLVSWDQRNCGKSESGNVANLDIDTFVEDAHAVTQYLKKEFNSPKIYILCHSWGSIIGINLIQKYPADYPAYIGMGQFVNADKAEAIIRKHVLDEARINGDSSTLNELNSIGYSDSSGYKDGFDGILRFRFAAGKYMNNNEKVTGLDDAAQSYDDYANLDRIGTLKSVGRVLYYKMQHIHFDLSPNRDFKIPVYFFAGRYDYPTPSELVEAYYKTINAPAKKLYWFENSGHAPIWEEKELFNQRLFEIVAANPVK